MQATQEHWIITALREGGWLNGAVTSGNFMAYCPVHEIPGASDPSLSVTIKPDGKALVKCHAGCEQSDVIAALQTVLDRPQSVPLDFSEPDRTLTLREYRDAKLPDIPVEWLEEVGVHEIAGEGVGFHYWRESGEHHMTRIRRYLDPPADASGKRPPKMKTPKGKAHDCFYFEWCLSEWRVNPDEPLYLCEGETDAITLRSRGFRAVGIIGAGGLNLAKMGDHLAGFRDIVVVIDNDEAGKRPALTLADSAFAEFTRVLVLPAGTKDINEFYLLDTSTAKDRILALTAQAPKVLDWKGRDPYRFFIPTHSKGGIQFVSKLMADELQSEYPFALGDDGSILRYVGNRWLQDGDRWIEAEAASRLEHLYRPDYVNSSTWWFRHKGSFDRVSFSPPEEDRAYIHCASGIIDVLEAARLGRDYVPEPSTSERAWLAAVPWEYDPTATCPGIETFFRQVLHDDAFDCYMEVVGYAAQFHNLLRKAILCIGTGNNGKDVANRFIRSLLGLENVSTFTLGELTGNRFVVSGTVGKLANICSDIGYQLPDEALFKRITGNAAISGERKFRDPFSFLSGALPIFSCNVFPRAKNPDRAFFKRWIVFEFPNHFEDNDAEERRLAALMRDEAEMRGLFRLAVEGAARLAERGNFDPPRSCIAAKEKFIASTSPIRSWIDEMCDLAPRSPAVDGTTLWRSFDSYCVANGFQRQRSENRNMFFDYLATLDGVTRQGRTFTGIALRASEGLF